MSYGWQGTKVQLVPLDKEKHFHNAVRWINDPVVTAWTLIGDYPLTRLHEQDYFDRLSRPCDNEVGFAIELREEGEEHIGFCGAYNVSLRHGVGTVGLFIGRPKLWGRGLGTDTFRTLMRYGFEVLGLQLLLSEALTENVASVRMHAKCGFVEYGVVPGRYWKRGSYRDVTHYYLARAAWRAANPG
jgi:RimJ/RimL family protein N-acetyltransferase